MVEETTQLREAKVIEIQGLEVAAVAEATKVMAETGSIKAAEAEETKDKVMEAASKVKAIEVVTKATASVEEVEAAAAEAAVTTAAEIDRITIGAN